MSSFRPMSNALASSVLLFLSILHPASAGLCEDNPTICRLVTGCYADRDGEREGECNRKWWAFVPTGEYACDEGVGGGKCPLYLWIDGTEQEAYEAEPDQLYMLEMLKRGFVAANVEWQNKAHHFASGCEGSAFLQGLTHKTQSIFDASNSNSVVSQLCDGPNAVANCNLGIATHGHSQGANIASLAGNYDDRVSASLMFSNGNHNPMPGDLPCLNSQNLILPRERRRSISGENDAYFGFTRSGVLEQQIETSGYDCGLERLNCFARLPEEGPKLVPDIYVGGDALIEDAGGYYIITGKEYCAYMGCQPNALDQVLENKPLVQFLWDIDLDNILGGGEDPLDQLIGAADSVAQIVGPDTIDSLLDVDPLDPTLGVGHIFFQDWEVDSDFMGEDTEWGLHQNLDWLARTAKKTRPILPATNQDPTPSPAKSQSRPTFGFVLDLLPAGLEQLMGEEVTPAPTMPNTDTIPTYAPTASPADVPNDASGESLLRNATASNRTEDGLNSSAMKSSPNLRTSLSKQSQAKSTSSSETNDEPI